MPVIVSRRILARYNITGISDIAKGPRGHLGTPKVSLSFAIDGSGIVGVSKAEAVLEEMVEVIKPTPKPKVCRVLNGFLVCPFLFTSLSF